MAQFDVFRNPGRNRNAVPFVVSLQSSRFEREATRLVAALVGAEFVRNTLRTAEHWLAPSFDVAGRTVFLDVFNMVSIPAARLGPAIASLSDEAGRQKLTRAVDELLSQA